MRFLATLVALLGFSGPLEAAADLPDAPTGERERSAWSLGMAAVVVESPYAGEGTRLLPVPLVGFESKRFFIRGTTLGWKLIASQTLEIGVIGKLRADGFNVGDLGRDELTVRGIDALALEDRDMGFDIGIGARWTPRIGEIEVELLADAAGASDGQEATVAYGYPLRVGGGVLKPTIAATWQSKQLANYYYGTLDSEVERGAVHYRPGATSTLHAGFEFARPVGERWVAIASARYSALPGAVQDSPLVQADIEGKLALFLGVSRGF